MQDPWSHLLLVTGLSVPIVTASLMQAAAITPTPTTMVSIMSANPTVTESHLQSHPDLIPTTSPILSVISSYKVSTPTPGSVAIINGIPHAVLKDTTPSLADTANADGSGLYQPWNTSYPGPIHDGDWAKYLQNWDPVWWSMNLDSIRQTSCHCSADDFYTNPQAQLAAYMNFEYYSHQDGNVYAFDWACGPTPSSMSISQRITSDKRRAEHCWSLAGGDEDANRNPPMKDYFCDPNEVLCVKPWRDSRRQLKFHGHVRNYDRHGVHTWSEIQQVVTDVCEPVCRDKFLMNYDDFSHHNPSFVTSFYPPKPIDLTIVGD
ncbi:MAG: hypothetical protein Q9175_005418 [Cornicularia normoerica]